MKNLMKFLLVLLLIPLIALTACGSNSGGNSSSTGNKEVPSTITYVGYADPMVFWDPAETWAAEIKVLQNIYETLVRVDPLDNNKFIPVLAESWEESEDHLKWTFHLREGVKFHSGKELTADIAACALNRTIEMGKGASYIWKGVKDIKAVDDTTLEITLEHPLPMLFVVSSGYGAYIYDPDYSKDWYYEPNADGTGPYKLMSYKKDSEIVLQKFDDYWAGWPEDNERCDYAIIKVVSESATRRQMLVSGEADVVEQLPVEDIQALKNDENIAISDVTSFQQLYGFINTQKPPLDNKLVRQALAYLLPYQDIIDYVMLDTAVQDRGVIPPTLWGHGEDVFQYTYNPEKAKQLLAEAGYPDGGFKLLYTYTAGDKNEQKVGELFKDALQKVNIDMEIRGMTVDSKYNLCKATDPKDRQDITMLYWWPDNVDPSGYMFSQFHSEEEVGFNFGYYSNPEVDRLIEEAIDISGISIEEATKKYVEAQKIIVDESPALMIYCENYVRPYRKSLGGYKDNPAYPNVVFFYDVYKK
jgi:peptide/nickel transport system substrate-binding protein